MEVTPLGMVCRSTIQMEDGIRDVPTRLMHASLPTSVPAVFQPLVGKVVPKHLFACTIYSQCKGVDFWIVSNTRSIQGRSGIILLSLQMFKLFFQTFPHCTLNMECPTLSKLIRYDCA